MNTLAIMQIPMPIFISNGSGETSNPNVFIALFIALNIVSISIFMIRSLIWALSKSKREDWTFVEYAIWSDTELFTPDINTTVFSVVNGGALIVMLTGFILNILQ